MTIIKNVLFLDETKNDAMSEIIKNNNADEMILEITGNGSIDITVEGRIESKDNSWSQICGIGMLSLTKTENVSADGSYSYSIRGYNEIRIINNSTTKGGVRVYGRLVI